MFDERWLLDLCFFIDIITKLSYLNNNLREESKLITNCYQDIKSFIAKLKYLQNHLKLNNATPFPHLKKKPFWKIMKYSENDETN